MRAKDELWGPDPEREESKALVVAPVSQAVEVYEKPQFVIERATERATALAAVVEKQKLYTIIGGKKHVRIEGWTLLGAMCRLYAATRAEPAANGYKAEARVLNDAGVVVGGAEATCLRSEENWADKPDFALKSMAQTRAASKALRLRVGFVMALAGYETTPAEEMEGAKAAPYKGPRCPLHPTAELVQFARDKQKWWAHQLPSGDWCNLDKAKKQAQEGLAAQADREAAAIADEAEKIEELIKQARELARKAFFGDTDKEKKVAFRQWLSEPPYNLALPAEETLSASLSRLSHDQLLHAVEALGQAAKQKERGDKQGKMSHDSDREAEALANVEEREQ